MTPEDDDVPTNPLTRAAKVAALSPHLPFILFLVVFGIDSVAEDTIPHALYATFPTWVTWLWAGGYVLGGTLAIIGCVTERVRAEASGLAFLSAALLVYVLAQADHYFVVMLFIAVCAARLYELRVARDGARTAERMRDEWSGQ